MVEVDPQYSQNFYRLSIKTLIFDETRTKFLLTKEDNGKWDFAGGGLDHGEGVEDCIRREIKEEMGLQVIEIADEFSHFITVIDDARKPIINIFYEIKLANFDFTPSNECTAIDFFTTDEMKNHPMVFNNVKEFARTFRIN
jgi:ADP-ribose pyrophosphatase YjhB (NUDIX family)